MKKIIEIFLSYKWQLLTIYTFMALFELSAIFQPYLLGKSIDGLLQNEYSYLCLLVLSYTVCTLINWKRMVYDTKVYTFIYNNIVLDFWKNSDTLNSAKIARTEMARDIVSVLEGHVSYYIGTIITIIGSIWIIYATNSFVGITVTLASIGVFLSAKYFLKKIQQSIRLRNDQYEKRIDAMNKEFNDVNQYLIRKRKLEIFESTIQGGNWSTAGLIKNIFLILGIVIMVKTTENISVGTAITLYSYMNNFLIALMSIPVAFEMVSRLTDIFKRLKTI